MSTTTTTAELEEWARKARWLIVSTVAERGAGHIGGPLSAADLLVALYFDQLRIDPARPDDPNRDRFVLSKGHAAIGLYAVLALRGYFPVSELATFDHGGSRLQAHPDARLTPGVDFSTGSLGQGLSNAVGIALAAQRLGRDFHTWVMLGDGECQEGQVWEALLVAPRLGLDRLTAIIDVNGLQQFGFERREPDRFDRGEPLSRVDLPAVLRAMGWDVIDIDGHDLNEICGAYAAAAEARGSGRPTAIVARTAKGHGVEFTRGTYRWHNGVPTSDQLDATRAELGLADWPEGARA